MKNPEFDKKVGEWLKGYRKEHGLTQEQMGQLAGKSRLWYREIERGRNSLLLADAKRLFNAIGVDINEMINEIEP